VPRRLGVHLGKGKGGEGGVSSLLQGERGGAVLMIRGDIEGGGGIWFFSVVQVEDHGGSLRVR